MDKYQLSERDICTKFITPALQAAGWQQAQFREEVSLTDGRVMVREDGCRAVPSGGADEDDRDRVVTTIEVIGLNRLDRLNSKRADVWEECREKLASYAAAAGEPLAMKQLQRALIVVDLKKRVAYESELSSVAEACIRKVGSEVVCAQVFG